MTRPHKYYASDQIRFINYLRPSLEHSKSHAYSNLSSQHYKYLFRPIFLCRQQNHVRKTHTSANVGLVELSLYQELLGFTHFKFLLDTKTSLHKRFLHEISMTAGRLLCYTVQAIYPYVVSELDTRRTQLCLISITPK